jgi:hypothetical protein
MMLSLIAIRRKRSGRVYGYRTRSVVYRHEPYRRSPLRHIPTPTLLRSSSAFDTGVLVLAPESPKYVLDMPRQEKVLEVS